jgi:hypothetical protein
MSRSLRLRILALVGALALGTTGALVGLAVSAGAQSAARARPVAHLTSTTTLDHFACYTAAAAKTAAGGSTFSPPAAVELFNQFAPQGLWTAVGPAVLHCNPVQKTTAAGGVTPITNPDAHLLCYTTPQAPAAAVVTQPTYQVTATNQFGSALLDTGGQPVLLCLPTWKNISTTVAPGQVQVEPPGLDHFLCYPAKVDPNSSTRFTPPPVTLKDEFMKRPLPASVLSANLLCLPTAKALSPLVGPTPPVNFDDLHLVCFALKVGTSPTPSVFDQNQFGSGVVTIKKLTELCVPSTKTVSSPGGQVVITKTDEAGIPLIGAGFTAYAATDVKKASPLGTCTTGAAGVCTISPLLPSPGSYIISETSPPPGYSGSPDQTVTITTSPGSVGVTFTDTSATGAS